MHSTVGFIARAPGCPCDPLTRADDIITLLEEVGRGADGADERLGCQVHHHGTFHGVAHQSLPRLLEERLGDAGQERTADDGVHDGPNLMINK